MKEKEIRNKQAFDKYLQILEEDTKSIFDKNRFFEVSCPACGSLIRQMPSSKWGLSIMSVLHVKQSTSAQDQELRT